MTGRLEMSQGLRIAAVGGGLLTLGRFFLKAGEEGPAEGGSLQNWGQVLYLGYLLVEWSILLVGFWHVLVGLGLTLRDLRQYYLIFFKKSVVYLYDAFDCQSTARTMLKLEIYQGLGIAARGGALLALLFLLRRIAKRLLPNYQKTGKSPEGEPRTR